MTGICICVCVWCWQAILRTVIILRRNFLNNSAFVIIKSTGSFAVLGYTKCSTCFIINICRRVALALSGEEIAHIVIRICGNGCFCFIIFNCNIRFLSYITAYVIFIRYRRAVAVFFLSHSAFAVISICCSIKASKAWIIESRCFTLVVFLKSCKDKIITLSVISIIGIVIVCLFSYNLTSAVIGIVSIVFILLLAFVDTYIIDFLSELFDKIIIKIKEVKNEKRKKENKLS